MVCMLVRGGVSIVVTSDPVSSCGVGEGVDVTDGDVVDGDVVVSGIEVPIGVIGIMVVPGGTVG